MGRNPKSLKTVLQEREVGVVGSKKVSPDKLIPMDEEDFKDF
jgi:hypothetical protein